MRVRALVYSLVETLPSVILKYDLPCSECETEEWYVFVECVTLLVELACIQTF